MGVLVMSDRERQRKALFEMVKLNKLTLVQTSIQCDLSYRQTLRAYARYVSEGDAGLLHKGRGRKSNRKHPKAQEILTLYQQKYEGFGPTLAAEYLEKDGYLIDHETLRKLLLRNGLWKKQRKRSPYRQRREPKAQFGELVQIDGSIHDWLGTSKKDCLLNMVDDATSKTLAMLDTGETTRVVFLSMWRWIERYGIPLAFYVDLKTVYVSPKDTSFSHVEIACKKLGIRIIKARSPQAKGRVERNHAVYQDRLVKELKLRQIKTIDGANAVLEGGFVEHLNHKFEKQARAPDSAHRPLGDIELNQILCWEYERHIQPDWTFSFCGKIYQIAKIYGSHVKPRAAIQIRKHLDGTLSAWYQDEKLSLEEIAKRIPVAKPSSQSKAKLPSLPKIGTGPLTWEQSNAFLFKAAHERPPRKTF